MRQLTALYFPANLPSKSSIEKFLRRNLIQFTQLSNQFQKRPISKKSNLLSAFVKNSFKRMSAANEDNLLLSLRQSVADQGNLVLKMKANNAPELDVKHAVNELKARKKLLAEKELELQPMSFFDRPRMEDLLKRRFFYDQSFAIYGGVSGQFDFGPMGCAIKSNILAIWKKIFVLEEQMLEVDCSVLTPESVLKASGHVDRFADLMVKDVNTGECFRLDHLIKNFLEKKLTEKESTECIKNDIQEILTKLDGMTKDEMGSILLKYNIKSPTTGNNLSQPLEFNLMFGTHIGPTGQLKGFLRPETAQGIFVNFKRLLEFNNGKLPFGVAQIGNAFRNEISPRSGILRVREFTMAEIEYFCDPNEKDHPKFENILNNQMTLYTACSQMSGESALDITIGEAVQKGLVDNETLGYFMAKIQLFLLKIGVDRQKLRFRQHMSNEMAHYAKDCWDAECLTSYGWIECVGCADRSAYDLKQHSKATGIKLSAEKRLQQPKSVEFLKIIPNKVIIGKTFKKDAKNIYDILSNLSIDECKILEKNLNAKGSHEVHFEGNSFELTNEMITVEPTMKVVHVEEIIPNVIEPSFGIGRIMYSLLEHNFRIRENDDQRCYFTLPALIAPLKCSVLPLSNNADFKPFIKKLSASLTYNDISHKVDESSGSIGKRYARADEVAVPYIITIDFDTLKDPHSVTLRERDSMKQIRIAIEEIGRVIFDLSNEAITWNDVEQKYPLFEQQENIK